MRPAQPFAVGSRSGQPSHHAFLDARLGRSTDSILNKVTVADGVVANFVHAGHLTLTWLSAGSLRVDYPESSDILFATAEGIIVDPKPRHLVKMTYQGVVDGSGDSMRGPDTCAAQ